MTTTDDEQPTGVVVRPIRFTDDVEAMRDFLVLLGLQPRIAAKGGGWVDMVAGAGMVALHDAASATSGATAGETYLSFEAEDLDGLAERLTAAGVRTSRSSTRPGGGRSSAPTRGVTPSSSATCRRTSTDSPAATRSPTARGG